MSKICPKCKREIDSLICYSWTRGREVYEVFMENIHYSPIETESEIIGEEWRCPECDTLIASNESEALQIFKKLPESNN